MAKTKISEWSATPANNTDIDGINIAEGCAPSGINDAIREMMAQVKDLYAGTSGDATAVAGGGTGATTASAARANLGLAIGTDVQAYNANLTAYGATGIGFRNRIINGDMRIDQRNAGAEVNPAVSGSYYLDRWIVQSAQTGKFKIGQSAGAVTPPAGFTKYLGCTSLSAYSVVAADAFNVGQRLEGLNVSDLAWGTASAAAVTLSFWVRSSLTGTFGGSVQNSASDRSYPFSYTVSAANTWEQKTVTIAGDTTGTWLTDNGVGIRLFFSLGTGATQSGTAGAWASANYRSATGATSVVGTNGATFYITGVQLEAGSVASPFERRGYGSELMMCQRYYCKTFNQATAPAQNAGSAGAIQFVSQANQIWDAMWRYPVEMRDTPATITTYSTNAASANWSTNTDTPVAAIASAGSTGLSIRASTPGAGGRAYNIHASASAEL
jgi:hypothetical protein